MNQLQVTKKLILDAAATAEVIEAQFGAYLLPPEPGVYLPGSSSPAMQAHEFYYQLRRSSRTSPPEMVPVKGVEDIKGAVFDRDGRIVVPAALAKDVSLQPSLPVRGMAVVYSAVDQTLRECAAWSRRSVGSVGAFLADHLKEEFRQCLPDSEEDQLILLRKGIPAERLSVLQRNTAIREQMTDLLGEVRYDVRQFVGQDKWVMHFHYASGRDIEVEKTVDFRIYQWEMEHGHEYSHIRR